MTAPAALPPRFDAIPRDLTEIPRWVAWRYEERNGKPTKVPCTARGDCAATDDPSTWSTFAVVRGAYERNGKAFAGAGIVFNGDRLMGIDLDKCRNPETGEIAPWALEILRRFPTYTEASPSGTGVKLFLWGKIPGSRRRTGHTELYDSGRYFTVTGHRLPDAPATVTECQAAVDELYVKLFGNAPKAKVAPAPPKGNPAQLVEAVAPPINKVAALCAADPQFEATWEHRRPDLGDSSASGYDLALASRAAKARWHDAEIAGLIVAFRLRHGLDVRKAMRNDYLDRTIAKAHQTNAKAASPEGAQGAAGFFEGSTFIPLRLACHLRSSRTLVYGVDPEKGHGRLMAYANGVWRPAVGLDVAAQAALGERSRSNRISEAINALSLAVDRIPWERWNPNRRLVNCASGMLDPVTLEVRPHSPEDFSTMQIPIEYDPAARSEDLDRFLAEVLPKDSADLALMIVGYLLVPDVSAKRFFVIQGPPDSGKTAFTTICLGLVGSENYAVVSLHDLADNRFASAALERRLVGFFDDIAPATLRNSAVIKTLTGGQRFFRVEHKGEDAYNAPLYARLLFTCNEMPPAPDKSNAWYNRLVLLPFKNRIPPDRQNRDMPQKLGEPDALRALFRLAAKGLQSLASAGWRFPQTEDVRAELQEYRRRNDTVVAFVEDECEVEPQFCVGRHAWYEKYETWCRAADTSPESRQSAYGRLRDEYGCKDGQTHDGARILRGIRFRVR